MPKLKHIIVLDVAETGWLDTRTFGGIA